jgi:hypothetical protein
MGSDGSNAQCNFEKCLQMLAYALERQGVMPKRNFKSMETFKAYLQDEKEIIPDVSELPSALISHRSKGNCIRVKKRHTYKELIVTTKTRKILYISKLYQGNQHDCSYCKLGLLLLKTGERNGCPKASVMS